MSFDACLAKLRDEGVIDDIRARRFQAEYDRLNSAYRKTMGAVAAADMAGRDALSALEYKAATDRRQKSIQIRTQQGLLMKLRDHLSAGGDIRHFAVAVMEHHEAVQGSAGVENVRGALYKLAWSRMNGFLDRYRRNILGQLRNTAELENIVRALRGEKVDDPAATEMAAAVADTMEWLRQSFNREGGDIPKLDKWGLPQSHDAFGIAKAGLAEWKAFIRPLLDPASMIDRTTGKAFADDNALDEALTAAWRNISSEGMDGAIPGAFTGQGKIANRRSDHRFFVFKDADAWLTYNRRFGGGDVLDAITGHIDGMTRDIAAMRVLGTNPGQTIRWLGDVMRQDALPDPKGGATIATGKKAGKSAAEMQRMWDYYSGALTAVPPEYRGQARFFSGLRNWNVASKLGSAALSAIPTDPVFKMFTARFNGLPVAGQLGNWLKTFNPADAAHREAAAHAGLIFNEMTARGEQMWREGRLNIHEITRRGADALLRATLLTPHTVAAKQALGLGFMKDWADNASTSFDALAAPKQMALERYGIDASDWDRLRETPVHEQGGVRILRPGDLARGSSGGDQAAMDSAIKFFALIDSEGRFDTPGELLRAQTAVATLGGSVRMNRGTIGGELLNSATQFKTYSAIMMMTHLQRALYGRGGMGRLQYGLGLPIALTFGGVIATALIDISLGKDPPPLSNSETWWRGFVRGGGLGIAGDLASASLADQGGTTGPIAGFVTGPTLSTLVDPAVELTIGNIGQAARGKETNWQREALRAANKNLPGGNAWYARLAISRLMTDQLQEMVDPDYRQAWSRMAKRAHEQRTDYWWAPGADLADARAPDWANVFAPPPEPDPADLQGESIQ